MRPRAPAGLRRLAGTGRRPLAVVVAAVALIVAATIYLSRAGGNDSPAAVAEAFVAARRDGDCDRLLELLSQESWSAGGELSRREFLGVCPRVVDQFEAFDSGELRVPEDRVHVSGETAVVELYPNVDRRDGRLVREDGEWRVVAAGAFRLGRTPHQTVLGYLEAYADGDCERLADYVSDAVVAANGGSRDDYVDRCADAMPAPDQAAVITPRLPSEYDDPVDATDEAVVELVSQVELVSDVRNPALGQHTFAEDVRVVEEQLEWRLDPGDGSAEPLAAIASAALASSIVDDAAIPGSTSDVFEVWDLRTASAFDEDRYGGRDSEDGLRDASFRSGAHRSFQLSWGTSDAGVGVLLWQFASPDGAGRYAHRLVELLLTEEHAISSVEEHAVRGEEVTVPGLDEARGIIFRGEVSGVEDTHLVAAHDDVVVAVEFHEFDLARITPEDGLNRAAEILQTQLDALEATAGG